MDFTLPALASGALAMIVVAYLAWSISREPAGTPKMNEIASHIEEGTKTFIKRQYRTIAIVILLMVIPLALSFRDLKVPLAFLFGASLSLLAAYIGLQTAVKANVRTANAALISSTKAFTLAFSGGAVMGLSVVGLSLTGISLLLHFYQDPKLIVGFGFGASLAALFAQLGGGIFTKAADISADFVGKIEQRIPEDDPRNPAVIADQVGDNVGDCAGRGSDLFESISDDYVTAMILGSLFIAQFGEKVLAFPLMLGASGVLSTIAGVLFVRKLNGKGRPITNFNLALLLTASLCVLGALISSLLLLDSITIFYAVISGLAAILAIGLVVQYYTGINGKSVRKVAESSERGAAINIITGLSYALQTPFMPILIVLSALLFSWFITGHLLYGIVAANLGTDLVTGIIMAGDAFGPISDNAVGIAELSGTRAHNGKTLDELDALGNTTKAYTKAFATASSTVSTIVIFAAYCQIVDHTSVNFNLLEPTIIAGLLLGASLPFLFSSLAIGATGKTAYKMVDEVRRQFRENPSIIDGKAKPNYARCVDIGTKNALKQMISPGLLAVASPIVMGLLLGKFALGAMLLGGLATSALLAPFFTFGGGIWDNAKKYIERKFWMKGTPAHAAAVTGDAVGDPLKDVAGPSLNIFMKLTNMTALLIAPIMLTL
ncbi:MAG: sodium-translocating pyrophosphatase [Candidatus Bathyarchaeia archaeon]